MSKSFFHSLKAIKCARVIIMYLEVFRFLQLFSIECSFTVSCSISMETHPFAWSEFGQVLLKMMVNIGLMEIIFVECM